MADLGLHRDRGPLRQLAVLAQAEPQRLGVDAGGGAEALGDARQLVAAVLGLQVLPAAVDQRLQPEVGELLARVRQAQGGGEGGAERAVAGGLVVQVQVRALLLAVLARTDLLEPGLQLARLGLRVDLEEVGVCAAGGDGVVVAGGGEVEVAVVGRVVRAEADGDLPGHLAVRGDVEARVVVLGGGGERALPAAVLLADRGLGRRSVHRLDLEGDVVGVEQARTLRVEEHPRLVLDGLAGRVLHRQVEGLGGAAAGQRAAGDGSAHLRAQDGVVGGGCGGRGGGRERQQSGDNAGDDCDGGCGANGHGGLPPGITRASAERRSRFLWSVWSVSSGRSVFPLALATDESSPGSDRGTIPAVSPPCNRDDLRPQGAGFGPVLGL